MAITFKTSQGQVNEYYGLSTDTKPSDPSVPNASTFYEMDTGKLFMFSADSHTWLEQ